MTDQTPLIPGADLEKRYNNLGMLDRGLAEISLKPRWSVYVATAFAITVAWIWLSFLSAGSSFYAGSAVLGPGMALFGPIFDQIGAAFADNQLVQTVLTICSPQNPSDFGIDLFIASVGMWFFMSLAMMLPSAMPMMRTYGDIADVAAQKGEKVVSLSVLVAGYLIIWAVFSVLISLVQLAMIWLNIAADPVLPLQGFIAGLILLFAGAYQFSALKNACLEKCRNPFSILFGKWTSQTSGVFKLGVEQGLFCLGCCWALMLVMLVVGTMNLAWMAFFTLFAIIEKSGQGKVTSYFSGGILLLWGGILSLTSIVSF